MEFYIILYIYTHARIYACMCVRNTPTFPLFRQLQQRMAPPRTRRHTQQPPVCAEANISINNAGRNPDGVGEARRAASAERKWTRGERPTLLRSPPTNKSFTRREERKREERLFPRKGKRDEEKKGETLERKSSSKRGGSRSIVRAPVLFPISLFPCCCCCCCFPIWSVSFLESFRPRSIETRPRETGGGGRGQEGQSDIGSRVSLYLWRQNPEANQENKENR